MHSEGAVHSLTIPYSVGVHPENKHNTRSATFPGISTACRWGVESGKLVYSSAFGYVPSCVYMNHGTK
jgi:hypothetical protein